VENLTRMEWFNLIAGVPIMFWQIEYIMKRRWIGWLIVITLPGWIIALVKFLKFNGWL